MHFFIAVFFIFVFCLVFLIENILEKSGPQKALYIVNILINVSLNMRCYCQYLELL